MRILLRGTAIFALSASLFGQTPVPVSTTKEATLPAPSAAAKPGLVPQKAAPAVEEIAPNTPIAILQGICDASAAPKTAAHKPAAKAVSKTCKTVITKAEMEATLDILVPGITPDARRQFALNYIRMLAASSVAQDKRLANDPAVAKELEIRTRFTKMQVMASSLYRRVEKLGEDVPESELQSYYSEHASSFLQGDLERLMIPKSQGPALAPEATTLKAKAEEFRARAASGEDFEQLQKEIVQSLNAGANLPPVKMPMVRRLALPLAEAQVFDLKPGEVTGLLEGPSGFEILKLVSVKPLPVDAVRAELTTALTNGNLQIIMKDATKDVSAHFNLAYLKLPSTPELFLSPSLRTPAGQRPGTNPGTAPGARPEPGSTTVRRPLVVPENSPATPAAPQK